MRASIHILLLSAVACSWASRTFPRSSINETNLPDATPKRYIVELTSLSECATVSQGIRNHNGLSVVKELNSEIFPAVSVECEGQCNQESLRTTINEILGRDVVATVYKTRPMQILPTIQGETFNDDSKAMEYSVHADTGVDKLHEAGIRGKGALVALVDSGVQYTHPAVRSRLGVSKEQESLTRIARRRHRTRIQGCWRFRSGR